MQGAMTTVKTIDLVMHYNSGKHKKCSGFSDAQMLLDVLSVHVSIGKNIHVADFETASMPTMVGDACKQGVSL